jgi:hypothetical protein
VAACGPSSARGRDRSGSERAGTRPRRSCARSHWYAIKQNNGGGLCLDIAGAGSTDNLHTWSCNYGNYQLWSFTETEGGSLSGKWEIKSKHNGKCIDLASGYTENGTAIRMWNCNGSEAQRWILWGGGGMIEDWSDDMTSKDGGKWNYQDWPPATVNNEKQYYKPHKIWSTGRQVYVACENNGGSGHGSYTCGRMNTKHKDNGSANGAWSARLRYVDNLPTNGTAGTWPAFWALGQGINEKPVFAGTEWNSAQCGSGSNWPLVNEGATENDIWEYARNNGDRYYIAGHAGDQCQNANFTNSNGVFTNNSSAWFDPSQWHTFKMKFDGDQIRFYKEQHHMHNYPNWYWNNMDLFVLMNMAVGGNLGGASHGFNAPGQWADLRIDWVAHEDP